MCGVPHHAAETYIARLLRAGYKIAVCDQLEQPGPGQKLVPLPSFASMHARHRHRPASPRTQRK